jgi:hypothetical protein
LLPLHLHSHNQVLSNVMGMRDPRMMSEPLNPRALRMVKDTVKGMRVREGGCKRIHVRQGRLRC